MFREKAAKKRKAAGDNKQARDINQPEKPLVFAWPLRDTCSRVGRGSPGGQGGKTFLLNKVSGWKKWERQEQNGLAGLLALDGHAKPIEDWPNWQRREYIEFGT